MEEAIPVEKQMRIWTLTDQSFTCRQIPAAGGFPFLSVGPCETRTEDARSTGTRCTPTTNNLDWRPLNQRAQTPSETPTIAPTYFCIAIKKKGAKSREQSVFRSENPKTKSSK
jgi:hypothetical protein